MANDPWGVAASSAPAKGNDPWAVSGAAPAAESAPLGGAPGFGNGGFGAVQKSVGKAGSNATKTVGRAIVAGHKDPVGSALALAQAPQRGLQSLETNNETDEGKRLGAAWAAMTHPRTGKALAQKTKDQIGLGALERGPLAGNDLGHKLVRGALDIGLDTVNDPVTYAPGPDVLKIPGVRQGLEKLSETAVGRGAGALFNPDHALRGLSSDAKASHNVIMNTAKEAAKAKQIANEAIIKKHAAAIRSGEMPDEVAALFPTTTGTGLKPIVRPGSSSATGSKRMEAAAPSGFGPETDINYRPGSQKATPKVQAGVSHSPQPGDINYRPGNQTATPRDVSRPELAPNVTPAIPREFLNARPATAPKPKDAFRISKDAVPRSAAGQSTLGAWKSHFIDSETGALKFGPGMRPQDVSRKLAAANAPETRKQIIDGLTDAGFFKSPDAIRASSKAGLFSAPADQIETVQNRLRENLTPKPESDNLILKGAKALTHRGNQAFLANPLPHVGNLSNLAYNKYGAPTAIKGLVNGARVAMGKTGGHLGENINELESLGAKSQYGNIFDELGLTRIAGIPGTEGAANVFNKAVVPLQRASNYAQHKVLNSAETGLRSAALDAERAGGVTGAQAAKNIHSTFGTDAPTGITRAGQDLAAPFFKFHAQTAPGSVLNALAQHPGRITNTVKANDDYNHQVNPHGPKYHSTVPGANAARMFMDPLGYFGSLGPIEQLGSPNGLIEQLKKKNGLGKVIGENAGRFIPESEQIQALSELLKHKKNPRSKASGIQDTTSGLFGGYYGK